MRRWGLGPVVVLLLLVPAAIHAAEPGHRAVDAAWVKAMKANDVNAVMKCYAPDAAAWLPGAPAARGEKAIRATYEGLLSANTVAGASITEAGFRTARNVVVSWGTFSLTLAPKAGGAPVTMAGRYTEVAERRGGKWVYVVDHASAEPAPSR